MPAAIFSSATPTAHIHVRGDDAAAFLQGQFTNDLSRVETGAATYGLWLNHKGRVLADSFVLARGPKEFEVVSFTSPVDAILPRLEAYIIADDVVLEDRTSAAAGFVVAGTDAPALLKAVGIAARAPGVGRFDDAGEGATLLRVRASSAPTWALLFPSASEEKWRDRLQAAAARGLALEVNANELAAKRIAAGIPEIPRELGPGDLPGEGGLEEEAISYTKGCYLGQEVMARLRNLGQVRRRLFVVRLRGNTVPVSSIPAPLFLGERAVGELRRVVLDDESAIGFAMLQLNAVAPGALLATKSGEPASIEILRLAEGRAW